MTTVHTQSPKAKSTTPIIKAKPPKAYIFTAINAVRGRISDSEVVLLPLKAVDGVRFCGGLMNMVMKEQTLYVIIGTYIQYSGGGLKPNLLEYCI